MQSVRSPRFFFFFFFFFFFYKTRLNSLIVSEGLPVSPARKARLWTWPLIQVNSALLSCTTLQPSWKQVEQVLWALSVPNWSVLSQLVKRFVTVPLAPTTQSDVCGRRQLTLGLQHHWKANWAASSRLVLANLLYKDSTRTLQAWSEHCNGLLLTLKKPPTCSCGNMRNFVMSIVTFDSAPLTGWRKSAPTIWIRSEQLWIRPRITSRRRVSISKWADVRNHLVWEKRTILILFHQWILHGSFPGQCGVKRACLEARSPLWLSKSIKFEKELVLFPIYYEYMYGVLSGDLNVGSMILSMAIVLCFIVLLFN